MFVTSANAPHSSDWAGENNMITIDPALPSTPKVLVSDEERAIFQWVIYTVLLIGISTFGSAANIINIICFVHQGLKDPFDVSLLGLAVSDCGIQVISLWTSIAYTLDLTRVNLPYVIEDFQYLVSAWPYIIFTGVTSWLTALITLERCFCIMAPLKVKRIITSKRVALIIACVFILFIIAATPTYYVKTLTWTFSSERNRTILQLIHTSDQMLVEQISVALCNVFIPFGAYLTIVICTAILVFQLRKKARWRMTCTKSLTADITSERDQKLYKMVIFIVCYSPICLVCMVMFTVPALAFDGPNQNALYILGGICMLLQTTNSSANIFIYYRMSSKYRTMFRKLLCKEVKK